MSFRIGRVDSLSKRKKRLPKPRKSKKRAKLRMTLSSRMRQKRNSIGEVSRMIPRNNLRN